MVLIAAVGPYLTADPIALNPIQRLKPPSAALWFGSDFLGRDVFARVVAGPRVSLVVGLAVAVIAVAIGQVLGMVAGLRPAARPPIMGGAGRRSGRGKGDATG